MPLQRRVPKRGFYSRNRIEYQLVNVSSLERFDSGQTVDPELLEKSGLIKKAESRVKILGNGEITKQLTVRADAFSGSAQAKITGAGGEAVVRESAPVSA